MAKRPTNKGPRLRVAVVTGTRAEFGLLRPVMHAIRKHKRLELLAVAAGAHFLPPARTIREVEAEFDVAARVPMQRTTTGHSHAGKTSRAADAESLGRGVSGFARAFKRLKPDWVVVLGDRIEAFAAASAASIAGIAVCHIHGGDRAEGVADEAMRHAISKLAHLHCAATRQSAERLVKMGEKPGHVHVTGSPALDGLDKIKPMSRAALRELGDPGVVLLMHPAGLASEAEEMLWGAIAGMTARRAARGKGVLWLNPNHDPGREAIIEGILTSLWPDGCTRIAHLPRESFVALLKALARRGGALVGNSSAGLIEAAATGIRVYDLGPRQRGRESHPNVRRLEDATDALAFWARIDRNRSSARPRTASGASRQGRASAQIAALLAQTDPREERLLRKHNAY